jgi:hypothetical protein
MRGTELASLLFVFAAAACGDHEDSVMNMDSARTSVDQIGQISTGMSASNTDDVAGGVLSLLATSQAIVTPRNASDPPYGLLPRSWPPFNAGTGICSATACAFTSYEAEIVLTETFTINGSITRDGDALTFDLTYGQVGKWGSMEWGLDGSVTHTATQLDGTMHGHGTTGGAYTTLHVTWDVTVDFAAVTLDAQGCPVDGSVRGAIRYRDDPTVPVSEAEPRSPSFDVEGTLGFGPTCGESR